MVIERLPPLLKLLRATRGACTVQVVAPPTEWAKKRASSSSFGAVVTTEAVVKLEPEPASFTALTSIGLAAAPVYVAIEAAPPTDWLAVQTGATSPLA